MRDLATILKHIHRPPLLVRAARAGQAGYKRERHLPKSLKDDADLSKGALLMSLVALEQDLNRARQSRAANYTAERHVRVLIALMAEAEQFLAGRNPARLALR